MEPRLGEVLRRGWRMIVAGAAIGALVAFLVSPALSPGATASAVAAVSDDSIRIAGGEGLAVDELRHVIVAIAEADATIDVVASAVGFDETDDLTISALSETRSPVLTIVVRASSMERAVIVSDALPGILATERQRLLRDALASVLDDAEASIEQNEQRAAELVEEISTIESQRIAAETAIEIDRFHREVGRLDGELQLVLGSVEESHGQLSLWESILAAGGESVVSVQSAVPGDPGPSTVGVALVGHAAGAALAFGLLLLRDERSRSRRARAFDATVGNDASPRWRLEPGHEPQPLLMAEVGSSMGAPGPGQLDAYRRILDQVVLPSASVVGIAGTADHDGSGGTAMAMAHARAETGASVVLISTHLPVLSGAAEELQNGLAGCLTQGAPLDDSLIEITTRRGRLRYLPPGAIGSIPDLGIFFDDIVRMVRGLTALGVDLVIVELAPLLVGPSAVELARITHGVVLSTVAPTRSDLEVDEALRRLQSVRCAVLGEVTHHGHVTRPLFVRAPASNSEGELIDLRSRVSGELRS